MPHQRSPLRRPPHSSVLKWRPSACLSPVCPTFVHDPSTVVRFHGKYYVFSLAAEHPSTPRRIPSHGRTRRLSYPDSDAVHALVPKNNGTDVWARNIIRMDPSSIFITRYPVGACSSLQLASPLPVLNRKDPAYKWTDHGVVVSSNGTEDLNAIDPGVILAPDGTMDLLRLLSWQHPHHPARSQDWPWLPPNTLGAPVATASGSEATDIIFHDGSITSSSITVAAARARTAPTTSAWAARAPLPGHTWIAMASLWKWRRHALPAIRRHAHRPRPLRPCSRLRHRAEDLSLGA